MTLAWYACSGEKLWVPEDNESQRNNEFVTKHFPSLARIQLVYLEREDGGDILTPEAFNKALSIHNQILALSVSESGDNATSLVATQQLNDLCFNQQGGKGAESSDGCTMSNPLMLFGYDEAQWASRSALVGTLNDPTSWDPEFVRPGFVLDGVFGSLEESAPGEVAGAKVLSMSYLLANNKELVAEQLPDEAAEAWEEQFLALMAVRSPCMMHLVVSPVSSGLETVEKGRVCESMKSHRETGTCPGLETKTICAKNKHSFFASSGGN